MRDESSTRGARQPVARHGQLTSPHPLAQIAKILAVVLVVALIGTVSTAAFAVWNATQTVADMSVELEGDVQLPPTIGEIEGGVNLLLVGTDSCEGQSLELFPRCAEDEGGERNDVTMLLHIGDNPRRVTVVSFPRDMMVPIPSCPDGEGGRYSAMSSQMLNASYMYGGLACTVLTVENLTGVDIQFAGAIRWTGVINMSDAIGGVDVCVAGQIDDGHTGLRLAEGTHTLVGAQALQFLRIRHGIGDGSDLGRISNQQQFMSSMVRKLQSGEVLSDAGTLFNLATTAMQQVTSGQLLLSETLANPTRMVQIAMAVKDVTYDDIVFVQYPTYYTPGGERVMPLTEAAGVLFTALAENQPIAISGKPSAGNSQEVVGEAAPKPTPSASPSGSPVPTESGGAEVSVPEEVITLPDVITGQTAGQVTCTTPER
ncbi:MAG: LCP family protein [Microbacterium sp.]|uniref:LCP family protein n=1 Tax=Microbacterium sp. TaxID=51671 RepID=UPI003A835BAE